MPLDIGPFIKRPLVLGEHQAGLYLFHSKSQGTKDIAMSVTSQKPSNPFVFFDSLCNVLLTDNIVSLWHKCLGHIPLYKIKRFELKKK